MDKARIKGIVVILIVVAFYFFPFIVLLLSGEILPLSAICRRTKNEQILFGLAYSDVNQKYKLEMTKMKTPTVLSLGTSRIMQISDEWINDSISFYNAGGGIVEPIDVVSFLEQLEERPKILILNLDQFFFNVNSSSRYNATYDYKYEPGRIFRVNALNIYKDFMNSKFLISDLLKSNIGLNACANGNGFKNDGTYYYGGVIDNPKSQPDYHFEDCLTRIKKAERRFEYGTSIDLKTVADLKQILLYCTEKNIKVIAFIPPFAPTVQREILKQGDNYKYMRLIYPTIKNLFDSQDSFLYDFQYTDIIDSPDKEFIDGLHGSKRTYLKMWLYMMNNNFVINEISKPQMELSQLLNSPSYQMELH